MSTKAIYVRNHYRYDAIFVFSIFIILSGLIFDSPNRIFQGYLAILNSPSHLLTDYIAVGGVGATFFNAGSLMLLSSFMLWRRKQLVTGPIIAALFTLFGFSLFGKNLFNTIPITLGVYLYGILEDIEFKNLTMASLFGTALGPVVSYICFGIGLDFIRGFIVSYIVGIIIGITIPPLSSAFLKFHQGYTLYNIGFTAGVIGLFCQGAFNYFGISVKSVSVLSQGNDFYLSIILYTFFVISLGLGYYLNGFSLNGLSNLFKNSGKVPSDFGHIYGRGVSLINMSLLGIIYTAVVLILGQPLNGPTMGGIFTIFGFGIFGKHVKNVIPVLIGTLIALVLKGDVITVGATVIILFSTNLAPISGEYGILAGIVAGFMHMSIVSNVGILHGGLNLYNNGFAGGFVAATLVPICEMVRNSRFFVSNEEEYFE